LDIGTSQITVIVAEVSAEKGIAITGIGRTPSRGLRKGVVINIEATVGAIAQAVQQAETMAGIRISSVYASLSGSHIKGFNSNGIVAIKGKEVRSSDLDKVIEAAKAVAIPLDREVLHVLPQEFVIDDQDGIREPLGIAGVRLEARVHIVTGAAASTQNIVKCANRCGLSVADIVVSSLAAGLAVLTTEERELGVGLIDLGGGTTDVAVFQNGAVKHVAVIPVGGNHITSDIAAGLRTPTAAAESLKVSVGAACTSIVSRDETIEVIPTSSRPHQSVPRIALADIIEARVLETFTLVQRELVKTGVDDLLVSGIVLTGGGAQLPGIAQAAEKVFNVPVRLGVPAGITGLTEAAGSADCASALGLILHATQSGLGYPAYGGTNSSPGLLKRVGNWFSSRF
jgi:cell division protein FtsA